MLGVILACYREFEERVNIISETTVIKTTKSGKARSVIVKRSAYDIVKAAVDTKIGKFTKREIVNISVQASVRNQSNLRLRSCKMRGI